MADKEEELDEQEQLERDELDRKIRISKALQTMEKELQLPLAAVKPVLLKLLKTYDGNWEHIEDENYRLLADMVFQQQEAAEAEKAPGSSSGRKPAGKRATPRRAPRNSKRAESDDSDEHDHSPELIRRSKRVPVDASTHAASMASIERAAVARRGRASTARRTAAAAAADDDTPAWDPPLALPCPASRSAPPQQCQEPQGGAGRRELRRISTGMDKQTQTEEADFEALARLELNPPTAIVSYEEPIPAGNEPFEPPTPVAQPPTAQPMAAAKQENAAHAPVYLPGAEVRRQIFSRGVCNKCEKPTRTPPCGPVSVPDPLVFDPSRVKIEGQAAPGKGKDLMYLNPEPLQTLVPTSPLRPLALAVVEPPVQHLEAMDAGVMQLHASEPLLLTFPSEALADGGTGAETAGLSTPLVPSPMKPPICELPKLLVPCSVQASIEVPVQVDTTNARSVQAPIDVAVQVDATNAGSSLEPKDTPPAEGGVVLVVVENPLMEVEVGVGPSSKVEVEGKVAVRSTKLEVQQPTENSVTEGALAALASYIAESDDEHTDMSPKREPRVGTSEPVGGVEEEEGVEQGRGEPHGILPLASTPSVAVLASSRVETLPEQSRDSVVDPPKLDNTLPTLSGGVGGAGKDCEMVSLNVPSSNDSAAAQANSEIANEKGKHSPDNTSSESSKKRKRHLIKKPQQDEHQEEQEEEEEEEEAMKEKRKQRYECDDISRGKEKVPISLSAPHGEGLPKDFYYINSSVVFQSAHVGISMARIGEDDRCSSCVGNCLDNRTPCECARMTNGEFAYSVEGYLYPHFLEQELQRKADMKYLSFCQPGACPVERTNDEPCKGHIQRRFIKECWDKCGCTQLCGNRIVQRGIAHRLQVFWTEGGKGWGVRTLEHLPAGTFVCEYVGEILTNTEMWYRNNDVHRTAKHSFALNIDADWNSEKILKDEEALCLDGTYYGNVSRFINHRCGDSNLFDIPVEIESPDHHYYHLAFFTSKDVNENEELTWDYGLDFSDKDHQLQAFECLCGSSLCRGIVEDGKPWA